MGNLFDPETLHQHQLQFNQQMSIEIEFQSVHTDVGAIDRKSS